ncbi:MAG: SPOR domain-containing protein [Thiolinea sp.]
MNNNTTITALLIAGALTLSACTPMPHTATDPYTPIVNAPVPTAPETVPTTPLEQYVVQLTASNSQQKAQRISDKFAAEGYNAFVSPLTLNGRLLHRVQIGMFNNQDDANMVLAQMQSKYPADPYVAAAITKTP